MARTKTITDEVLLAAARAVFIESGIGAPSKEIARRAGVSEGVLFQRFSTKEELFFAAMIPPPVDVKELFQRPRSGGPEQVEKITFAMVDYFRSTLPVLIPLMSHPSFRFEDFARRQPDSPLVTLRRELMRFMIEEKAAGRLNAEADPGAAALVMWSTAQTVAFFEQLGAHDGKLPDELIRSAVRCLWAGIGPVQ